MKITVHDAQAAPKGCSLCGTNLGMPDMAILQAPALLGCVETPEAQDVFTDYRVYSCPCCGLVQTDVEPSKSQYDFVHSHAVGGVWAKHRDEFLAFVRARIAMRGVDRAASVLEIGPSVSPLARGLSAESVTYLDLMETCPFELVATEEYRASFFPDPDLAGEYDVIVASHVLEHSENLLAFLQTLKASLARGGVAVLSIPDFRSWIGKGFFNAFSREHVVYPCREQIEHGCAMVGLKAEFGSFGEHSLFMCLEHGDKAANLPCSGSAPERAVADWANGMNAIVAHFETLSRENESPLILAGASHLSQYLYLMSPQIAERAAGVVDNATDKHGKRMYGTALTAHPFTFVQDFEVPAVIVPPSSYAQEMARQIVTLNPEANVLL